MDGTTEPKYTTDDVVEQLKKLVDLSTIGNTLAAAKQSIVQEQTTAALAKSGRATAPDPAPNPGGTGRGGGFTSPELVAAIEDLHKTIIKLPDEIALSQDDVSTNNARIGSVAAFDRPDPVIIVGPNPLPVKLVGGSGPAGPGTPGLPGSPKPPTAQPAGPQTLLGRLWERTGLPGAGRAATARVGGLLGGTGASGLGGLTGGALGLAKFAGPVGIAVTAVTTFANVIEGARQALLRHTEAQIQAAKKFAEVSGPVAVTMAKRDIEELRRSMRQGGAQASSIDRLVQAEQARKNASEGLENNYERAKNELLAVLNDQVVPPLRLLNDIVEALKSVPAIGGYLIEAIKKREREDAERERAAAFGMAADMGRIEREYDRLNREAAAMMAAARDSARGTVFPAGGRLP